MSLIRTAFVADTNNSTPVPTLELTIVKGDEAEGVQLDHEWGEVAAESAAASPIETSSPVQLTHSPSLAMPVVRARTWLAAVGWRRHGLLGLEERPRG